jgi:hypothetical protein
MVSKARDDLPEPLTPVTTVMALWGTSTLTFLRLWTRALRMEMDSVLRLAGMSSWLAKGSSDSAFDSHCLNFELYDCVECGANERCGGRGCLECNARGEPPTEMFDTDVRFGQDAMVRAR